MVASLVEPVFGIRHGRFWIHVNHFRRRVRHRWAINGSRGRLGPIEKKCHHNIEFGTNCNFDKVLLLFPRINLSKLSKSQVVAVGSSIVTMGLVGLSMTGLVSWFNAGLICLCLFAVGVCDHGSDILLAVATPCDEFFFPDRTFSTFSLFRAHMQLNSSEEQVWPVERFADKFRERSFWSWTSF